MKKVVTCFICTLAILSIHVISTSALSVVEPCKEDTVTCKIEKCQVDNAFITWNNGMLTEQAPELRDCDALAKKLETEQLNTYGLLAIGAFAGAAATATLFLIPKIVKKRRK